MCGASSGGAAFVGGSGGGPLAVSHRPERPLDTPGLERGELGGERVARIGQVEAALAPVGVAGPLRDMAGLDEVLQHPVQALLRDPERGEQFGDREAGPPADEVQHAVVGTPEAVGLEDPVGVGDEVAVGEEQQLDQRLGRGRDDTGVFRR